MNKNTIWEIFTASLIILSLIFSFSIKLNGQNINCDYFIDSTLLYVDAAGLNIEPGDTICLECGHKPYFQLKNFQGDSLNYLTIINYGGQLEIQNDSFYGFVVNNCKYFKLTGTGDDNFEYGILISGTGEGASGLSLDNLSTNFEVERIEVCYTGFAGIMSKTNPRCDLSANRGYFTQRNTIFHDNYVHHTGGEGFYIGHSYYNGWPTTCNGEPDTLYPHDVVSLRVYNNIVDSTNYDGIQIDCAVEDCEIYDNIITNYGQADNAFGLFYGMTGIVIGGGSTGKFYNNLISDGKGSGFFVFGLGDVYVFNNLIIKPGRSSTLTSGPPDHHHPYGIFCDDRTTIPGKSFNFINNTIVSPSDIGIRIWSLESTGNRIYNNFILDPGVKNWNIPRAFIDVITPSGVADTISANNHLDSTAYTSNENPYFINADSGNYHSKPTSALIDAAIAVDTVQNIDFDLDDLPRPIGNAFDIGVYEYPVIPDTLSVIPDTAERCQNDSVSFFLSISNSALYSFQWLKDSLEIPGANDTILTISPLTLSDSGFFSVVVNNSYEADTSSESMLNIFPAPIVYAGSDSLICVTTICFSLSGIANNYFNILWTTSGDGVFDDDTILNPAYFPGEEDRILGSVDLILTAYPLMPCTDSISDFMTLTIDPCTEVQDISQKPIINIFPNPSRNSIILSVNGFNSKAKIKIFDLLGKIVYSERLNFSSVNQSCKIDISNLEKGTYILKIEGDKMFSKKLIMK